MAIIARIPANRAAPSVRRNARKLFRTYFVQETAQIDFRIDVVGGTLVHEVLRSDHVLLPVLDGRLQLLHLELQVTLTDDARADRPRFLIHARLMQRLGVVELVQAFVRAELHQLFVTLRRGQEVLRVKVTMGQERQAGPGLKRHLATLDNYSLYSRGISSFSFSFLSFSLFLFKRCDM